MEVNTLITHAGIEKKCGCVIEMLNSNSSSLKSSVQLLQ